MSLEHFDLIWTFVWYCHHLRLVSLLSSLVIQQPLSAGLVYCLLDERDHHVAHRAVFTVTELAKVLLQVFWNHHNQFRFAAWHRSSGFYYNHCSIFR